MKKIINRVEKVDCEAIVSEKFWHQFWQTTFSAESFVGAVVRGLCSKFLRQTLDGSQRSVPIPGHRLGLPDESAEGAKNGLNQLKIQR